MSESLESAVCAEVSAPAEAEAAPAQPPVQAEAPVVPASEAKPPKVKKVKKPRPWPLKILMELIAIILCLALFVVTVAGALVIDLRVMTSRNGISEILTQLIRPAASAPSDDALAAAPPSGATVQLLSNTTTATTEDVPSPLIDMVYEMLQSQYGEALPLTKDQVGNFLTESTAMDFLADKLAGAVNDFYSGTTTSTITREEIVQLIRENAPLIQETFGVELTDANLQQVQLALEEVEILDTLEQQGLMGFLEDNYLGGSTGSDMEGAPSESLDGAESINTLKQAVQTVRKLTSNAAIACAAGVFLVLALLLFLVNGTVPKTLSDLGITLLFAGLILSSVNLLSSSGFLQAILGNQAVAGMICAVLSSFAVVHYSILGAGIALIGLAITVKIIKTQRRKARSSTQ